MVVESLREAGYVVLQAPDADIALSVFESPCDQIGAVITDIVMPGKSGVELAVLLRRLRPQMPLLFLSGYADKDLSRRGVVPIGDPVMTKPCSHDELLRAVRRLLDGAIAPPTVAGPKSLGSPA